MALGATVMSQVKGCCAPRRCSDSTCGSRRSCAAGVAVVDRDLREAALCPRADAPRPPKPPLLMKAREADVECRL